MQTWRRRDWNWDYFGEKGTMAVSTIYEVNARCGVLAYATGGRYRLAENNRSSEKDTHKGKVSLMKGDHVIKECKKLHK